MAVNIACVFFRADDFGTAFAILSAMIGNTVSRPLVHIFTHENMIFIAAAMIVCIKMPNVKSLISHYFHPNKRWMFCLIVIFVYCLSKLGQGSEFLYFQF